MGKTSKKERARTKEQDRKKERKHREQHQKLLDGDSQGMDRRSGRSSRVMYTLTAINM